MSNQSLPYTVRVLNYLIQGHTLTNLKAVELWRLTRLGRVIFDLRSAGYVIHDRADQSLRGKAGFHSIYYIPPKLARTYGIIRENQRKRAPDA